tara:strand:- start:36 stop:1166 length:1131 start_codon:yes stop_codon:yes gene_type:complete
MAFTTIDDPSAHFQVKNWVSTNTGDGVSQTFDGNSDMKPDMIWHRSNEQVSDHGIFTSILYGIDYDGGDTQSAGIVVPNREESAYAEGANVDFHSFDTDGFTLDSSSQIDTAPGSSKKMTNWCWKGSQGVHTSVSADAGNSILAVTHGANTTAGFTQISWQGNGTGSQKIYHGLGRQIDFVLIKNREQSDHWVAWWRALADRSASSTFKLSDNAAASTSPNPFDGNRAENNNFFYVSNDHEVNASGENYVAFGWSDIQGYCKQGRFVGNGDTDGTFVYTGFRPAWLMYKEDEAQGGFGIWDHGSQNGPFNPINKRFLANTTAAQDTSNDNRIDFLSNGFKVRTDSGGFNQSGRDIYYIACAHQPFTSSKGVPANAR